MNKSSIVQENLRIFLLQALLAIVLFSKTQGPFIVDEFVYANIARDIFSGVSSYLR